MVNCSAVRNPLRPAWNQTSPLKKNKSLGYRLDNNLVRFSDHSFPILSKTPAQRISALHPGVSYRASDGRWFGPLMKHRLQDAMI